LGGFYATDPTDEGNQKQPTDEGASKLKGSELTLPMDVLELEVRIDQWVIINPKEYQLVNG